MSSLGLFLMFFRNIFPDWISLVIGNTLIVSSTVILLIGLEKFLNKKETQILNYLLIIVYLLMQSYFTFFEPDVNMRRLILSISYLFISSQIAWLMFIRTPLKMRIITQVVGGVASFLFLNNLVRIIFIVFKEEQATTFLSLHNDEAFFLLFSQFSFIMLAYSISLMYNKKLIIEVSEREKKITLITTEKFQLEIDRKNQELTQKALNIASMKEVNRNILNELKRYLGNFSEIKDSDISKMIGTFKNSSQELKIWEEFDIRFKEVHSEFYENILTKYPTLSTNEIRVTCLLHENYTTKEIAMILQRSPKTIENIRGLIRKKMNLNKNKNLSSFLQSFK
jgi:DNA-binding CsgD family transcriptional regulator